MSKFITGIPWVFGVIVACLMIACNSQTQSALAGNETIKSIFTEEEIRDLETIQDFFDRQICDLQQVQSDSVRDCYIALFELILKGESTGNLYIPVNFDAQREMYAKLSPAAFKQIWLAGEGVDPVTGEKIRKVIQSYDGKYMEFLRALKADNTVLEAYFKSFQEERRMTPVMIETVMYGASQYNLADPRMRLFIALHYLTLNDVFTNR